MLRCHMLKRINKKQKGYTLFEVMVAVVILSMGMMALGSIMVRSLRYSKESANRFVATQQLYEIADRMRANHKGVSAGNYDDKSGMTPVDSCRENSCTYSELAEYDVYEWNLKNSRVLPLGEGEIEKDGDSFIVTVTWQERNINTSEAETSEVKMRIVP